MDDNDADSDYRKETEKCMSKYNGFEQIRYVQHEKNMNGATARNTGINTSKGEYITFLDDDDYYMNNRLSILVNDLQKNPTYDCIYSSVAISEHGGFVEIREAKKRGTFLRETLCHDTCWVTGSNLLFTSKAIREVGLFDTSFVRHQDTEYMCRFFLKGFKIFAEDQCLVVKNQDDRINEVNVEKQIQTKAHFLEKFKDIIGEEWNSICFKNYFIVLWLCIKNKNFKEYNRVKKIVLEYGNINFRLCAKLLLRWIYCVFNVSDFLFWARRRKTKSKLGDRYNMISEYIDRMEGSYES